MNESGIVSDATVILSESDHADLIRTIQGDAHEESPVKKKGTRKKSGIWSLFTAIDRDYAVCNLCDVTFSYRTSISNLKKHLIGKHSVVPPPATKVSKENDSRSSVEPSEKNSPRIDRVQVKKEKITPEVPSRSRMYLEGCRHGNSNIMRSSNETEMRDEFDAIGVTIAAKLRKMDDKQRLFCERIINEALFKGAFEQLCPSSELVVYHVSTSPITMQEEQDVHQTSMADSSISVNQGSTALSSN